MFILEAVKNILDYRTVELPVEDSVHLNEKDILVNEGEHETSFYFLGSNYRTKYDFEQLLVALLNDHYAVDNHPLNYKEKFYLSNFLKPFADKVISVTKEKEYTHNYEWLEIVLKDPDADISLPYFEENAAYKNMKLNKAYSLAELDIL